MYIISGMHRSGTSLVARLFYEAGADLGDPEHLLPADRWNSDGYFEQRCFYTLNGKLVHGPWGKFAYFCLPSTQILIKRAKKHIQQIQNLARQYQGKIVKDPRFCLTFPAWQSCGVPIEKMLVCIRNPLQVANSIKKRNFIPIRLALNLWYIHNSRLLQHAKGMSLWFVSYHNILNENTFSQEMSAAYRFFGYAIPEKQLAWIQKKCITPEGNHHRRIQATQQHNINVLWNELLKRHAQQFQTVSCPQHVRFQT